MLHHTPLRYPGGKRRLADVVKRLLVANELHDVEYVEPFAGGAAVALGLLFEEYATRIHLNDLDPAVHAFWFTVLNDSEWLCRRLASVTPTMTLWKRQRNIYRRKDSAEPRELGFATLFLNRTNRSGILGGGVIGGQKQDGDWTLGVRFNPEELINRIKRIARYRDRIKLYSQEAKAFTDNVVSKLTGNVLAFYDPPYIDIIRCLYMNIYKVEDHKSLSEKVLQLKNPWIVTYDNAAILHSLYPKSRRIVYGLHYTAQRKYEGEEVMYFADSLILPKASELLGDRMAYIPRRSRVNLIRT